jgi:uncharacterized protein YdeI (YjbR/CyaY-like superfamily)
MDRDLRTESADVDAAAILAAISRCNRNRKAGAAFDAFPPGQRREYVEWITEAKREETRLRRIRTAIEWIAQGKPRYWKYANC